MERWDDEVSCDDKALIHNIMIENSDEKTVRKGDN